LPYKVLIVDDSKSTRDLVAAAIEQLPGFSVFQSASGFEALKALPRHHFDLVITDINMPDINGLELINFVKTSPNFHETLLFIVSTESSEADRQRGLALGACEYLVKPFDPELLIQKVRAHLMSGEIA
jgi:two-component system chemotaxis response regulator CheY